MRKQSEISQKFRISQEYFREHFSRGMCIYSILKIMSFFKFRIYLQNFRNFCLLNFCIIFSRNILKRTFAKNFGLYKVYLTPLTILKKPPPIPSLLDLILNPGKISLNPKGEGGVSITIYCSKLQSKAARGAWKTKWKKLNIENLWGQSQIFSIHTPPPSPTTVYIFIHMVITKGRYKKGFFKFYCKKEHLSNKEEYVVVKVVVLYGSQKNQENISINFL